MTNWNTVGSPLSLRSSNDSKRFSDFLGKLRGKDGEPLWEINEEDEIWPISYDAFLPEDYIFDLTNIVFWLKKNRNNIESGYAFTYDDQGAHRSVGGININNNGIKFCKINGDGEVTISEY